MNHSSFLIVLCHPGNGALRFYCPAFREADAPALKSLTLYHIYHAASQLILGYAFHMITIYDSNSSKCFQALVTIASFLPFLEKVERKIGNHFLSFFLSFFLSWNRKKSNNKVRKRISCHKMHHPRAGIERLNVKRESCLRGLIQLELIYQTTTIELKK